MVSRSTGPRNIPDRYRIGSWLFTGLAFVVVIAMVIPAFIVIPVSFSETRFLIFPPEGFSLRWYETYFRIPEWTRATIYSLIVAILTTATTLGIGIPAAFGLVRGRFRGQQWITLLFVAPLMIPAILIAMSEYFFLSDLGLLGTTAGLVVAHTVFALPFTIIIVVATLRRFDRSFELAAMSLGAPPLSTFWHVTLPLIRTGVISAGLLAFLASFNEFIISLFVIGATRATLPIQFWHGIRFETNPTIAAVASMLIVITVITLILIEITRWRTQKRHERDRAAIAVTEGEPK